VSNSTYFHFPVLGFFFRQESDWACQGFYFQAVLLRSCCPYLPKKSLSFGVSLGG